MAIQKSRQTRKSKRKKSNRKPNSSKREDTIKQITNGTPDDGWLKELRASPFLSEKGSGDLEMLGLLRASTPVPEVVHGCYAPLMGCSIRVMVMHEGDDTDIRFHFEKESLAHLDVELHCRYHALSYAWGEQFDDGSHLTHRIYCGDHAIPVTAHLHAGLRRIRDSGYNHLWVDAICINQADLEERGQQVSMMDRIFKIARQTIVWLGEEDCDSEYSSIEQLCIRNESGTLSRSSAADPFYDERHSVEKLFQRDWFNRRWALQEYILSREVFFQVGRILLRATSLADVARGVESRAIPFVLSQTFDKRWLLEPRPLVETMIAFNFSKCTVLHDCVYALLGISSDGDQVNVDYKKPVVDLFVDVTRDYILSNQVEDLDDNAVQHVDQVVSDMKVFSKMGRILDLSCASRRDDGNAISFMPSWIPLWGSRWLSIDNPRLTAYLSIPQNSEDLFTSTVRQYYETETSELEMRAMLSYDLDHNVVKFQDRFLVLHGIVVDPNALSVARVRMAPQGDCDNSDFPPSFEAFGSADTFNNFNFEDIFLPELDDNESKPDLHLNDVLKSQLDNFNLPRMTENDKV